ncbi:hypothetical protein EGH24_05785 [Halonotius terrestris]|uniref:Uncharacterized protein n=1 Tax=Halonotius terrestris TaxID=2487750 RepID=A0A8J8PAY4_9EURY|nr:hypothetical protein [Halonotius terrestris]TQQ82946.1 hypothetical protein EGH24_05785 [Halonotius terrestris]
MASARGRASLKGALTLLAAILLLAPVVAGLAWLFPLAAGILTVLGIAAGLYWYLTGDDASGDGSVWNAIPSRQYDGRHAESGGLSRGEQEAAIEEIQEDAANRDRTQ